MDINKITISCNEAEKILELLQQMSFIIGVEDEKKHLNENNYWQYYKDSITKNCELKMRSLHKKMNPDARFNRDSIISGFGKILKKNK